MSHKAENLKEIFSNVMIKYDLNFKITAVVHDNAPNIVKAMNAQNMTSIRCFAHSLQLCLKHSIQHTGLQAITRNQSAVRTVSSAMSLKWFPITRKNYLT